VREPRLLLLDEPFAALDALTRLRMQQLIGDLWQSHGTAALLVTHDVEEAILLADRVLVLRDGRIALDRHVDLVRPRRASGASFEICAPRCCGSSAWFLKNRSRKTKALSCAQNSSLRICG
jgi:sulfonate transport system ATP-binding protein